MIITLHLTLTTMRTLTIINLVCKFITFWNKINGSFGGSSDINDALSKKDSKLMLKIKLLEIFLVYKI